MTWGLWKCWLLSWGTWPKFLETADWTLCQHQLGSSPNAPLLIKIPRLEESKDAELKLLSRVSKAKPSDVIPVSRPRFCCSPQSSLFQFAFFRL